MASKKPPNWAAIKKRYLQGEMPKDIAKDYGLTAKQISNKAQNEEWTRKKQEISANVADSVKSELQELCDLTISVHKEFMRNLQGQIKDITNPYLFDGERTNSLFQTAMNNSVKILQAQFKINEELDPDDPSGFNIAPDA